MAAAAYRAGERLFDGRTGVLYDYSRRKKEAVIGSWIEAPEGSPAWVRDREVLWNFAEAAETRKNSRPAREAELALPVELTREEQDGLLGGFVREAFVERGMVADVCVHRGDPENPHAHVMLTTRKAEPEGFSKRKSGEERDWDGPKAVKGFRRAWELHQNRALEVAGREERVDHRTLRAQGVEREPTEHEGPNVRAMEMRGIYTERGAFNRGVMLRNAEREDREHRRESEPGSGRERGAAKERAVGEHKNRRQEHRPRPGGEERSEGSLSDVREELARRERERSRDLGDRDREPENERGTWRRRERELERDLDLDIDPDL